MICTCSIKTHSLNTFASKFWPTYIGGPPILYRSLHSLWSLQSMLDCLTGWMTKGSRWAGKIARVVNRFSASLPMQFCTFNSTFRMALRAAARTAQTSGIYSLSALAFWGVRRYLHQHSCYIVSSFLFVILV